MSDPIHTASEQCLQAYLPRLAVVLGHADRKQRLVSYCTGHPVVLVDHLNRAVTVSAIGPARSAALLS
jgi:hypothetical protein